MPGPMLPADVATVLRRVRDLEATAELGDQRNQARRGTANLIAAVHAAGWTYAQIAEALGVSIQAVWHRVHRHLGQEASHQSGLGIPTQIKSVKNSRNLRKAGEAAPEAR